MTSTSPKTSDSPVKNGYTSKPNLKVSKILKPEKKSSLEKWFDNLTIGGKQFTALSFSGLITTLGLVGITTYLIINNGRLQLTNQAKSELIITELNYNIKIDQMGFGFRGQSDNGAIINAAKIYNQGQVLPTQLKNQVKEILANEIKARNIEYATLVGKDLKIILNANNNRTGEIFDPNNLVSQVINNPQQIKTSEIIKWEDLEKEQPPLPDDFSQSDALIRYTITPVQDRQTQEVLAVLVSGDIVNNKPAIVEQTLKAFDSGYSAVYQINENQQTQLSTSSYKDNSGTKIINNISLKNQKILENIIKNSQLVVTNRTNLQGKNYTLASKVITNYNNQPVAILVRGTSEDFLNELLNKGSLLQLFVFVTIVIVNIIIALILARFIITPIKSLQLAIKKFSEGNLRIRTKISNQDEIGLLASSFNEMANTIQKNELLSSREQQENELLAQLINNKIFKKQDLKRVFNENLQNIRKFLEIDKLVVFEITSPTTLELLAETSNLGVEKLKDTENEKVSLPQELITAYIKERLLVKNQLNLIKSGFYAAHLELMEKLGVTTNLVIPIMSQGQAYGLLMAQSCETNYIWKEEKFNFLKKLAQQLGLIVDGFNFIEEKKLSQQNEQGEKEKLQQKALSLVKEIQPINQGDLSIRLNVTPDEIGTIADSYNTTIENLAQIITQVKSAAEDVSITSISKEQILDELSANVKRQTEEITAILQKIQAINQATFLVAVNAQQAEIMTQETLSIVESGSESMNRTVEGILNLKNTVEITSDETQKLKESSKKITKVVSLIRKFAAQTHLLALKASIEAARAGEQGQGFAVIADEVRSLAAQSADATQQIEIIVNEIQNETQAVEMAVSMGSEQVKTGTQLVEETKQNLTKINRFTVDVSQLIQAIANSTKEQTQDSEIISNTMSQISKIAEKNSISVQDLLDSFQEILVISQQLQETMAKFKVIS